jgi:hypothetical protein
MFAPLLTRKLSRDDIDKTMAVIGFILLCLSIWSAAKELISLATALVFFSALLILHGVFSYNRFRTPKETPRYLEYAYLLCVGFGLTAAVQTEHQVLNGELQALDAKGRPAMQILETVKPEYKEFLGVQIDMNHAAYKYAEAFKTLTEVQATKNDILARSRWLEYWPIPQSPLALFISLGLVAVGVALRFVKTTIELRGWWRRG